MLTVKFLKNNGLNIFELKIPFFNRLIYVAWSGGSMSSILDAEPTLWMILCWSHSRPPSVMTFCVRGGGALWQAVNQTVILIVSVVQRSYGSSGLVMILTYKGLYQQNWKVIEHLFYECGSKKYVLYVSCSLKNSIINLFKVTVDSLGA